MKVQRVPSRYEAARDPQAAAIRAQQAAARRESYNRTRNKPARTVGSVAPLFAWAIIAAAVFSAIAYGI